MKTHYVLESTNEIDFSVLAINSHIKAYRLCWNLNKTLNIDLEKNEDQKITNRLFLLANSIIFSISQPTPP